MADAGSGEPTSTRTARRADRGVVAVEGPEAADFLHGVVTNTVRALAPGEARLGALLTPQGKLLFDFLMVATGEAFLFEVERARIADFVKRLGFYRLRAKATITDRSADFAVFVTWGGPAPAIAGAVTFADPRLAELGTHLFVPVGAEPAETATLDAWQAHRIGLGVPESSLDFALGDVFPHDVDMDDLGGVDFKKGCFVGQEVVSRMKHRGTARKRTILARALDPTGGLPPVGAEIVAGGKGLGTLGSSAGDRALALVRVDRVKEALDTAAEITADGVAIDLALPAFARFGWPEGTAE